MKFYNNENKYLKQFNKIYKKYKNVIYYFVMSKIKDKNIREDIFQEVMLKVYKHICDDKIKICDVKNFIYTITNNIIKDYLRKDKIECIHYNADVNKIIDESYELKSSIRDFLYELTELERDMFVCHYILNMTKKNVSSELNIPYSTCKRMLNDINIKIKNYYKTK